MFFSKKKGSKDGKRAKKEAKKQTEEAPEEAPEDEGRDTPVPRTPTPAEIKELMAQGHIRVLITFELVGKPREHIEQTLQAYMLNIKQDERIRAINEEYAEPLEQDEDMFSAFCEFEALVEDLDVLTWLAVNFMPASIEILEPEKLTFEGRYLNNWYNDLISKLHEVSGSLREQHAVNQHLTQGMNALIKNAILATLTGGAKTGAALEKSVGIPFKQLEPFVKNLVDKGKILKDGTTYKLR